MIDTHTHIFARSFDEDRAQMVERAQKSGVEKLILPAIDSETHEKLIATVNEFPDVCFGAMGLHPTSVNDNPKWREELEIVQRYVREKPVKWIAVGEVGLDLYWSKEFLREQTEAFVRQIELSIEYHLPLIIHTRNAWNEMMEMVRPFKGKIRGVFHSFSGEERHLDAALEMGFFIGVGGPVTYKTSSLPELLKEFPMENMLLETDSPYLPPVPYRGQRNESGYVGLVADKIAEIKGVDRSVVDKITSDSARRLFFS